MKLRGIIDFSMAEIRAEGWLYALSPEDRKNITEGHGRTYAFNYPNYNDDPRPKVLVLGYWKNPNTGKKLLGGLNLNYMTSGEVEKLRSVLPRLLKVKDLKSRYWAGRKLLPDIFKQFYRTYNHDYVNQVTPGEITYGPEKDTKDKDKTVTGLAASKIMDKLDGTRPTEPASKPKPITPDAGLDTGDKHKAPEQPTSTAGGTSAWRSLLKAAALKKQREREQEEKTARDKKTAKKIAGKKKPTVDKPPQKPLPKPQPVEKEPAEEPEDTPGIISGTDPGPRKQKADELSKPPGDISTSEGVVTHPVLGVLWPSPATYREWHRPAAYLTTAVLSEGKEKPLLAVHNLLNGETLIDHVEDHATIIQEAGWDYHHVIRLLPIISGDDAVVVPIHDGFNEMIVQRGMSRVPPIVIESLLDDVSARLMRQYQAR